MALVVKASICVLVMVMVVRTFQSGTATDRLLGVFLLGGLALFGLVAPVVGAFCLLPGAAWYLTSQVLTGARWVSMALPVLTGVLLLALVMI